MANSINEVSIYCRCQRTPEQDRLIAALAKSTLIKRIGVYYVLLPEKQRLFCGIGHFPMEFWWRADSGPGGGVG